MKNIIIIFILATSLSCKGETNEISNKKFLLKNIEIEGINKTKALLIKDPIITSITFTNVEIVGDNHYGFKYDFTIIIDNSNNINLLNFCNLNLANILNNRVTDSQVIQSILNKLETNEVELDENPKGLRLSASTEYFDSVEFEIHLKENNLLKIDIKYYSPL